MDERNQSCSFVSSEVLKATNPLVEPNWRSISNAVIFAIRKLPFVKQPGKYVPKERIYPETHIEGNLPDSLNLQLGEMVQVRTEEEIFSTLDRAGKNKGLFFLPEMKKFCGKNLKVFKRVIRIKLETNGEMRKLKTPAVFLDASYCDGEFHENCDRTCFLYWREIWLKRV